MSSFLAALGYGCAALMGTAVGVAVWEHWRTGQLAKLPPLPAAGPTQVDIDLAELNSSPHGSDQVRRQTAVDTTLARMTQAALPPGANPAPWIETHPMVSLGPPVELKGAVTPPANADITSRTSEPH